MKKYASLKLAAVLGSAAIAGQAWALPDITTYNSFMYGINWLNSCWTLNVDGIDLGPMYGSYPNSTPGASGSTGVTTITDPAIASFPLSLAVEASAFGVNPGAVQVETPFGQITSTASNLTVMYSSQGQMALNEQGQFNPEGFVLSIVGGTYAYDLPAGNGSGVIDFAVTPIDLVVGADQDFGTWDDSSRHLNLRATAMSGMIPMGNTTGMINMDFLLNQTVPAPSTAMIMLAPLALAHRRRR